MARNQDRQFSESDSLQAQDRGHSPDLVEERLPAWAVQASNEQPSASPLSQEERQGKQELPPLDEQTVKQESARKDEARQAWDREATRVESAQERRFHKAQEDHEEKEAGAEGQEEAPRRKPRPARDQAASSPKRAGKKGKKKKKRNSEDDQRHFVKLVAIIGLCTLLFLMVALMIVSNFVSHPLLALPRKMVTAIVTPVQNAFSSLTDSVAGYLRTLKIRGNLEYEYEQLTLLLDEYATEVALNEELRRINENLYDLLDEQERNREMLPVAATVIGTDSNNYFSTLTLDVGRQNGVDEFMAVVSAGGLVGVTYNVGENECQVRCIISTDCTVAALVQSSRDQGSVKGTLGVTGEPMCRMYYLPDNSLPRPGDMVVTSGVGMEFPKGIPIGIIRESTRGMEDNKSYVVLEPVVDFQHLEFVTVYRYKPAYAEKAQVRAVTDVNSLEPLSTPRPVPDFQLGAVSDFLFSPSAAPSVTPDGQTPAPTAEPGTGDNTPAPTATPDPDATTLPPNLEYVPPTDADLTPAPTLRPTFTPAPTPEPTQDPGGMTMEDDA